MRAFFRVANASSSRFIQQNFLFALVNLVNGKAPMEYFCTSRQKNSLNPRNRRTSRTFLVTGNSDMALTLHWPGLRPSMDNSNPRYSTLSAPKTHFDSLQVRLAALNSVWMTQRLTSNSGNVLVASRMSSWKKTKGLSQSWPMTTFINLAKIHSAFLSPNITDFLSVLGRSTIGFWLKWSRRQMGTSQLDDICWKCISELVNGS